MKVTEAIFTVLSVDGKLNLSNNDDLHKYCLEHEGRVHRMMLQPIETLSDKERLYAFVFGPMMACAVNGFASAGWEGIDKVKARYMLEAELCKEEVFNKKLNKTEIIIIPVSGMNKERLLKFAVDACHFLEVELGQSVPDSQAWKLKLQTGKHFKTVK